MKTIKQKTLSVFLILIFTLSIISSCATKRGCPEAYNDYSKYQIKQNK